MDSTTSGDSTHDHASQLAAATLQLSRQQENGLDPNQPASIHDQPMKKMKRVIEVQSRYMQASSSTSTSSTSSTGSQQNRLVTAPMSATRPAVPPSSSLRQAPATVRRGSSAGLHSVAPFVTPAVRNSSSSLTSSAVLPSRTLANSQPHPQAVPVAPITARKPSLSSDRPFSRTAATPAAPTSVVHDHPVAVQPTSVAATTTRAAPPTRKPPQTNKKPPVSGLPSTYHHPRLPVTPSTAAKQQQTPAYYPTPGGLNKSLFVDQQEETISATQSALLANDLLLSQTRLLQWAFVTSKADACFEKQSQDAERQLLAAWGYVSGEQHKVSEREALIQAQQREQALTRSLEARNREVAELGRHIEEFQGSYTTLSQAVGELASKMPVKNVVVSDTNELVTLLAECSELLATMAGTGGVREVAAFSRAINTLSASVEETGHELAECCELVRQIEVAEKLERSLRIQQVQQAQEV